MNASDYASSPSLETLYCDHHGWLQSWLRRRLGNASDAADLVKPVARGFDSFGEARAYLRTVASGLCVDLWRRREIEQAWLHTLTALP